MRYKSIGIFMVITVFCLLYPMAAFAEDDEERGYTTPAYDVKLNVNEDHSYQITETITVNFTEERHGIYRYIPIKGTFYRNIDGKQTETKYRAKIRDISVKSYDHASDYQDDHALHDDSVKGDNEIIKIGNSVSTVKGLYTYTLSYTWDPGDDDIAAFDDVYYNVLPYNWATPIDSARFTVTMPKAFDAGNLAFYAGAFGSTSGDGVRYQVDGNTITGEITRALGANEGVTINLSLPQGYYVGARDGNGWNRPALVTAVICLMISLILFLLLGHQQKTIEPVAFYPPRDFNPAQIGTIIDGTTDDKDVVAMIIYLASKGYLQIEETEVPVRIEEAGYGALNKKSFCFHRKKDLPRDASDYEKCIFNGLFPKHCKTSALDDLEGKYYQTIQDSKAMIEAYFAVPERQVIEPSSQAGKGFITLLMGITLFVSAIACECLFYKGFGLGSFLLVAIPYFLLPLLVNCIFSDMMMEDRTRTDSFSSRLEGHTSLLLGILIPVALAAVLVMFVTWHQQEYRMIIAICYGIPVLLTLFRGKIVKYTKTGNQCLGEALGFRNFIVAAEQDRIAVLADENPGYFFDILPYAYVMDVTDQWVKNFEDLAIAPVDWYTVYDADTLKGQAFMDAFEDDMRIMNEVLYRENEPETQEEKVNRQTDEAIENKIEEDERKRKEYLYGHHDDDHGSGGGFFDGFGGGGGGGGGGDSW